MISIITPTHAGSKYLLETYESVKKQTYGDWEWIICRNNGGETFGIENGDKRIRVFDLDNPDKSVGRAKRFLCEQAKGEIIVELDHDDLLTEDALAEVKKAFDSDKGISQVYSHFCEFFYDHPTMKDWESNRYGEAYGWRYKPYDYKGHRLWECMDFEPLPSAMTMIWWAPNHIRAWRTEHYWAVGGHNPDLPAVDDFDLELRLYLYGKFYHIKKCLYLYRMTGTNTWIEKNKYIQETAKLKAEEYFYRIIYRWSEMEGLPNLKLEEIQGDLNDKWPIADNSVGVLKAWDKLQFIKDPIHAMSEAYRVLAPGGWLISQTPSTDGRGAFENPTFKSYWNENTFNYFTRQSMAHQIGNNNIKFQEIKKETFFPSEYNKGVNSPYVRFDGLAVKDGFHRLPGFVDFPYKTNEKE